MRNFKKILCMILAVVMIAGIMPRVEAQAATTPAKVTEEQVKQRMKVFEKMVDDGAYFTYNGKPCAYVSGHGCKECSTDKLIKSNHIKNYLGLLPESIYRLPNKYGRSCMSCKAFVLIAHWYLYAQKSTDDVAVNIVNGLNEVKFSSSNMLDSNGNPKFRIGDILESDSQSHSLIISDYYKENGKIVGFYTIDCNWGGADVGNCKVQERKYTFSGFSNLFGATTVYRATNYSDHVHDYSGNNNIGYCNSCKNDYLTTSAFSSSKVYTSGTVTPKTTAQLHVKMRPYAASTWTNGDANIKANSATMEYTCKNHWGHTWYCVKFKDSSGSYKTGYVYNGDVNFEKNPNTVSASCYLASRFGGKINEGDSLWVSKSEYGGSVKSTDGTTKLSKVVFGIYNTNGSLTSSKNEVTKTNINATSYTISSSDDTILFSSLSQGSYVFKITGYDVNGKQGSASFNFAVVKSGTTTYTVSYNANGGSGAPSSQTKIKDTTLKLSTQKPSRSGYTFLGWATSSSATSAQYQPGGSYTNNAGVTLYAVWQKNAPVTYTVSYNANGGSGAPSSQTKTHGVNLTLSSTVPYKSGYEFKGWQAPSIQGTDDWVTTKPSSGSYETGYKYYIYGYECDHCRDYGYDYDVDYTFYMGNDKNEVISTVKENPSVYGTYTPSKLRRFWRIETSYKGSDYYPGQVGSTYNYFIADYVAEDGSTGAKRIYKTHFYFESNVYRQNASTGKIYQPGATYSADESVKLTAIWEEQATYTVTYNANGGSGAPAAQTKTHDAALTLSTQKPTRSGYTFLGWATSSSATSAQYQPGGSYTNNSSVTLYAVWKAQTYTITYDNNGGRWIFDFNNDEDENGQIKKTAKVGESIELNSNGASPIRDNGELCLQWGWSTKKLTPYNSWYSGMPEPEYRYGDIYSGNKDITLYAVWIEAYGIMYNPNGGTFDYYGDTCRTGVGPVSYKGKTMTIGEKISNIVRDGYTFLGWSTDPNATTAQYQNGDVYNKNVDIDLYAVWKKQNTNAPTMTVATVSSSAGKEVTVGISIENNPGIAGMSFGIDYDKTRLKLIGYEDSGIKGWTVGIENGGASWADVTDYTKNGEALKLKFQVLDGAADGMAYVQIVELETFDEDEKWVQTETVGGGVNVVSRIPGDVNDDGKVDSRDAIRLSKYLAKEDVEINLANADVTGDGKVNVQDLIRLKKYLAKVSVELV